MKVAVFRKLFFLVLLLPLVSVLGCSTTRVLSDTIIPGHKAQLGKRVMVVPILCNADLSEGKAAEITNTWVNYLKKDDKLIINLVNRTEPSELERSSSEYGIIIPSELVEQAEEMDMDILVTATINPFDIRVRKKGIWPFRKLRKEITITMDINVLDISNGALVLSLSKSQRFNAEGEIVDEEDTTWDVDNDILDEELSDIMDSYSDSISDALGSQLWTGKITSAENQTIMINGGRDIGISKGDVFEVFGKGEAFRAVNGRDYYTIGEKVGEVRTDQVMDKKSRAIPLNSGEFKSGQMIRLKR